MTMDAKKAIRAYRATRPQKYFICDTSGCGRKVEGYSKYCGRCKQSNCRYGHPTVKALDPALIRHPRDLAKAYLTGPAREHERIAEGLAWCNRWMLSGEPQGDYWSRMGAEQCISAFMHRLERGGTTAADILATLAALAYIREYCPGNIRSDRHYRFCTVRAILNLQPWPVIGHRSVAGSSRVGTIPFNTPRPRVIEAAWQKLPAEVLVLAQDIAAICRDYEETLALFDSINSKAPLPGRRKSIKPTTTSQSYPEKETS